MPERNRSPKKRRAVRRMHDVLRSQVLDGAFGDSVTLPSEVELQAEFGVPRSVVRDALAQLVTLGLVERVQGVGTVATARRFRADLGESHGVVDQPAAGGVWGGSTSVQIVDWRHVPAPPSVQRVLGIGEEHVLRVDYVPWFAGEPLAYGTNYMVFPRAGALDRSMLTVDWYRMLTTAGIEIGESTFHVEAAVADEHDAGLLRIQLGAPVTVIEQTICDSDGRAFDYAMTRLASYRLATGTRRNFTG